MDSISNQLPLEAGGTRVRTSKGLWKTTAEDQEEEVINESLTTAAAKDISADAAVAAETH